MIADVKASELAAGVDRVYLPGERGFLERERRQRDGVPIAEPILSELQRWGRELGIPPIRPLRTWTQLASEAERV